VLRFGFGLEAFACECGSAVDSSGGARGTQAEVAAAAATRLDGGALPAAVAAAAGRQVKPNPNPYP
jgi:hypothetical protein